MKYKDMLYKCASFAKWAPIAAQAARNRALRLLQGFAPTTQKNIAKIYQSIGSLKRFQQPNSVLVQPIKAAQSIRDPRYSAISDAYYRHLDAFTKDKNNSLLEKALQRAQDRRRFAYKALQNRRVNSQRAWNDLVRQNPNGFVYNRPPSLGSSSQAYKGFGSLFLEDNSFALNRDNRILLGSTNALPLGFHQMGHIFDMNRYPNAANLALKSGALKRELRASALALLGMERSNLFTPQQIMQARRALKAAYKSHKYGKSVR